MFGANLGPYLERGEWQVGSTFRTFRADEQYQGTRLSQPVTDLGTQVISKLQTLDLTGTYALNRQLNLTLNVPYITYGSSSRALPANMAGSPRFVQSVEGLGDISLVARRWLLDCDEHMQHNISLGFGFKAPTGNSNAMDRFPNGRGENPQLRPLDPSIQPGDGGWGIIFDVQAFRQVGTGTVFFSGVYLANPRGQNNTLSPPAFLNPNGPSAVPAFQRFNTVPDQYVARLGWSHPVPDVRGLNVILAGRLEGVPTEDFIGKTEGFRRPGYSIAVEPGLLYSTGRTVFSITFPVVTQRNIRAQIPGVPRDSTFADYSIIASVTHRFGGKRGGTRPAMETKK